MVDLRDINVNPNDLMEVVVQAFYCLHAYNINRIAHCLTYVHQRYYLILEEVTGTKMNCVGFYSPPDNFQVAEHVRAALTQAAVAHAHT